MYSSAGSKPSGLGGHSARVRYSGHAVDARTGKVQSLGAAARA